jgi:hypothetical protein
MKRLTMLLACLALLVPGAAHAAQTSVEGTGAYEKLVLANKQTKIVVKMYGPGGGPCEVDYVTAKLRDKDGTRYTIAAGCYPGAVWGVSLSRGDQLVECEDLKLAYQSTDGYWNGVMPRSCLDDLANRVKVTTSWIDDGSPTANEAGPTRYVARD